MGISHRWQSVDLGLRHLFLEDPMELQELAAVVGYSPYHFSRVIHKVTGLSLRTYLNRVRILKARRLLAQTDQAITEIALAVGYSSLGTFGRYFHALVGLSPSQFRRYLAGSVHPPQPTPGHGQVEGRITRSGPFVGRVHIGLFPTAEPIGFPVAETWLDRPGPFFIEQIPPGRYHVIAIATCCYQSYPGDVARAWGWGASRGPVDIDESGVSIPDVELVDRMPTSAPILATFLGRQLSKYGEAEVGLTPLQCGLNPTKQKGGPATMIPGIASVLMYVRDMDKSVDFYGRLLATAPSHQDPTTVTYDLTGLRLILHRDKLPARAGVRGAMEFNLQVADAQGFYTAIRTRGIEVAPPQRMPWGWVLLTVQDPDGNVIEFYELPQ